MLVVKQFFTEKCSEFHDFLLGNKNLLKHIHWSEKYLPKESKTVILNTQASTTNTIKSYIPITLFTLYYSYYSLNL